MRNDESLEIARFEGLNADLSRSLQQCRNVLDQWRSRMTASSNDAGDPDVPQQQRDERQA